MKKKYLLSSLSLVGAFVLASCNQSSDSLSSGGNELNKATNLRYNASSGLISWDAVANATSYQIQINEEAPQAVTGNSFNYSLDKAKQNGGFSVTLTAQGDGYADSTTSMQFTYLQKINIDVVHYVDSVFTWDAVSGATGYDVYLGTEKHSVSEPRFENTESGKPVDVSIVPTGTNTETTYYFTEEASKKTMDFMGKPSLQFSKDNLTFSWDSVVGAEGYTILIKKDGQTVDSRALSNSATTFTDYTFTGVGSYEVKLAAKGNREQNKYDSGFASLNITRLGAPANIVAKEVDSGVNFDFDDVPGATGYIIKNSNQQVGRPTTSSFTYNGFNDINNETMGNFTIQSYSDDPHVLDSIEEGTVSITKLAQPQNVKFQSGRITWDIVNKATQYEVYYNGNNSIVSANEYTLKDIAEGEFGIRIRAIGNETTILKSSWSNEIKITKLRRPANLTLDSRHVLRWDQVNGAKGYKVLIDNGAKTFDSQTNLFDLNSISIEKSTTLVVQAMGDGANIVDSELSSSINLTKLDMPINVKVSNSQITWNTVPNANSYVVKLNNIEKTVTGTTLNTEEFVGGSYTVTVQAKGENNYFDSTTSQPITVTKLSEVNNVRVDKNGIHWDPVSQAEGYEVRIDDRETYKTDKNTTTFNAPESKFTTAGKHTISVRAKGNDAANLIDSSWKTIEHNVTKLNIPTNLKVTKTASGFDVTAEVDTRGVGIHVVANGKEYDSSTNKVSIPTLTPGDYQIKAASLGDGFVYVNSELATDNITLLDKVSGLELKQDVGNAFLVNFTPVRGADWYQVTIKKYTNNTTDPVVTTQRAKNSGEVKINTTGLSKIEVEIYAGSDDARKIQGDVVTLVKTF